MGQVETFIIKLRDQFSGPLHQVDAHVENTRRVWMDLREMMEGAIVAYGIERFVHSSVEAFNEFEQAAAQVRASLSATGHASGKTFDELHESAERLQKQSLFTVDAIMKAQSALATNKGVKGNVFDRATQDALDMASKPGGAGLDETMKSLGVALQSPTIGMQRLRREGIIFSESQKAQIKIYEDTNQLAKAQSMILDTLEGKFRGSAAAAAAAGTGGWTVAKNSFLATQEKIGGLIVSLSSGLLPVITHIVSGVSKFVDILERHQKAVKVVMGLLGGFAIGLAGVIIATKAWVAIQAILDAELWANPIGVVVMAIAALVGIVYEAWENFGQFRGAIRGAWEVMKQVGSNIKNHFLEIPKMVIEAFKEIPKNFIDTFKNIGKVIGALLSGNFKAIPGLMKDIGADILKTNPLTMVPMKIATEFTKGTTQAFKGAYDKEMSLQAKIDENAKKRKLEQDAKDKENKDGDTSKIGAGLAEIKTGAPKTFNINIQKQVGIENFETVNVHEAPGKMGQGLLKEMLTVLNNAQAIE